MSIASTYLSIDDDSLLATGWPKLEAAACLMTSSGSSRRRGRAGSAVCFVCPICLVAAV